MIIFEGTVKYKDVRTGEKVYRAEVELDGKKRVLSKPHKRARDAEAYGIRVVKAMRKLREAQVAETEAKAET